MPGGMGMGGRRPMMGIEESIEAALGLGELAGLTISNEADALSYDVCIPNRPKFHYFDSKLC